MNISTIIALIIISLFVIGAIIQIIKGFAIGKISIGYKYFGNSRSFTRKNEALAYYTIIGIYLISIVVCLFIAEYVIKKNL